MQLTGPYYLSSTGQIIQEYDPAKYTSANSRVQIQNYSGFLVTAVIGGSIYLLPSLSASTIETNKADLITLSATQVSNAFGQSVNLVWLQEGEQPAMADGPLILSNTQSLGLKRTLLMTIANFAGTTQFLPAPPVGMAWSVYDVNVQPNAATAGTLYLCSTSSLSSLVEQFNFPAASSSTTPINGLIFTTGLWLACTVNSSAAIVRYDLFPAPIS